MALIVIALLTLILIIYKIIEKKIFIRFMALILHVLFGSLAITDLFLNKDVTYTLYLLLFFFLENIASIILSFQNGTLNKEVIKEGEEKL